ncbi:MAG: hypothetical protein RLZZ628_2992 [Bacteroidota bacterium]|jgi:hypothetical protein
MKFAKSFLAAGLILFLAVLWTNCRKDGLSNEQPFASSSGLQMNYEVETMSSQTPVLASDASKLAIAERILGEPKVKREKVQFNLASEGSVNMCITSLVPKNTYQKPSNSLPNNAPKVAKTIIRNGTADAYDAQNKLLSSNQVKTENLKKFADLLKNLSIDPITVANFKKYGKTSNSIVFEKDNIVGIQIPLENGGYLINVYDFDKYLQLSSEEHYMDDKIKSRQIFFIEGDYKTPQLKGIHEQRFFKSEVSGVEMVSNVYQQIDDFQIINNLK